MGNPEGNLSQSCDRGYFQIVPINKRIQSKTQDSRQVTVTMVTNLDGGLLFTLKRKISPHLNLHGVLSMTTPNGSSAPATSLSLTSQLNLMTQNQMI